MFYYKEIKVWRVTKNYECGTKNKCNFIPVHFVFVVQVCVLGTLWRISLQYPKLCQLITVRMNFYSNFVPVYVFIAFVKQKNGRLSRTTCGYEVFIRQKLNRNYCVNICSLRFNRREINIGNQFCFGNLSSARTKKIIAKICYLALSLGLLRSSCSAYCKKFWKYNKWLLGWRNSQMIQSFSINRIKDDLLF